ncbi:MAG: hypothetical protein AAF694_07765 [Bacteroidota bacterium]
MSKTKKNKKTKEFEVRTFKEVRAIFIFMLFVLGSFWLLSQLGIVKSGEPKGILALLIGAGVFGGSWLLADFFSSGRILITFEEEILRIASIKPPQNSSDKEVQIPWEELEGWSYRNFNNMDICAIYWEEKHIFKFNRDTFWYRKEDGFYSFAKEFERKIEKENKRRDHLQSTGETLSEGPKTEGEEESLARVGRGFYINDKSSDYFRSWKGKLFLGINILLMLSGLILLFFIRDYSSPSVYFLISYLFAGISYVIYHISMMKTR